jgi:hypothetical protein
MSDIAFIETPGSISLTGNPVNFTIAGRNAFTGTQATFAGTLNKSAAFDPDQNTVLTWGTKSLTLTAKAAPEAFNEISTNDTNVGILAALLQQPDFVADFTAEISGNVIAIVARKSGSDYNLVKTGSLAIDLITTTAGSNKTAASNYKLIAKVEHEGKFISEHSLPVESNNSEIPAGWDADAAGIAEIDISDILAEETRGHFTLNFETGVKHTLHDILTPFRIYAHEQSLIPPVNGGGAFSALFYALQGKLENFLQGELNYLQKNFADLLTESQMFLSFAPLEKYTDIYAPERLNFAFINAGTYRMWCEETYEDGTTYSAMLDQVVTPAFRICEFDVSYRCIRTNFDRKLVSYKIWITNNADEAISEDRTFILDYNYYQNARYFYFRNSLGVYECIRITGTVSKTRPITKDFINIPFDKRFTNLDREEKQLSANCEQIYDMNFGYFPNADWSEYSQQFLISADVYWLKKDSAYPVSIRDSKNKVSEDGDYNPAGTFQLIHSNNDDFKEFINTNAPISIGDFNFDFNSDFFIGSGILYLNELQSKGFTKNDCGEHYNGSYVIYAVAAGTYSSTISQDDANAKALADIEANGQNNANLNGTCILDTGSLSPLSAIILNSANPSVYGASDGTINIQVSGGLAPYYFTWSDGINTQNRTGLKAGAYSCEVVDSIGNKITLNQALTNPAQIFYNTEQSQAFRRNNCSAGQKGTIVTYTVAANTYQSLISIADANAQALADIAANGQNYANSQGVCELVQNGTLTVQKTNDVTEWAITIQYADGETQTIDTLGAHSVRQMGATVTISGQNNGGILILGTSTFETLLGCDTPTYVTFELSQTLTISY